VGGVCGWEEEEGGGGGGGKGKGGDLFNST